MANVEAKWSVDLYVECPKCQEFFDLNSDDTFTDGTHGYALETSEDVEVARPECGNKFKADLVW